jgi:hypothetical protein
MAKLNLAQIRRQNSNALKQYERFGVKVFLEALKKQAINFDPKIMQDAYLEFYTKVFVDSAKKEYNLIRVREKSFIPPDFFLATWTAWIKDWAIANLGFLIQSVNEVTLKKIQETLADAVEQGLNPFQTERLLLEQVGSRTRARAIARTESTRANAMGKERSATEWANETGSNLYKVWVWGGSREPRIQHLEAQNKPIPKDGFFQFTNPNGEVVLMQKPGDLSGGASQTINCSCTVVFMSERFARRNYPESFTGQPVRPIQVQSTIQINEEFNSTNSILLDSQILSEQSKSINDKIKSILQFSDGTSEYMNRVNSFLGIRTSKDKSSNGAKSFVKRILGTENSAIIGYKMDANQNGNAVMSGKFMNIEIKKDSIIEFRKINALTSNEEINELLKNQGYKLSKIKQKTTKDIEIVLTPENEVFAFKDKKGNFAKWSVRASDKKNIAPTITHESAHILQGSKDLNWFGEMPEWQNIYQKNGLSIFDAPTYYGKTNAKEFFAETYTAYVYDNERLQKLHPKLYKTFVEYLNQIGIDIKTIKIAK